MICKKCRKKIKGDIPYCEKCYAEFQAWLGISDYYQKQSELQGQDDLCGYEDDQWRLDK